MANVFEEEFDDALRYISNTRMNDKTKRQHIEINIEGYYTSVLIDCFAEVGFYDPKSKAVAHDFSSWEILRKKIVSQRSKYAALEAKRVSKISTKHFRFENSDDDDVCPVSVSYSDESDGSCCGSEMVRI
jgi:hypothetical protein